MGIRGALAYAFGTRYFVTAVQLLGTVFLARLLTPEEFGIYSVGAAVIMIAHTLRDFGISTYLVQERSLDQARVATAFGITITVAWTLATALLLAASPLASFYREPGVEQVLRIMSLNFFLIPFGSISIALLRREMNFRALMYVTGFSAVAHTLSSVMLAASGLGFESLAWGAVIGTSATVVGAWIAKPDSFLVKPSFSARRHVLSFSMKSTVASLAAEAGHAAPDIVLGRTVGMEGTGLFTRALGYALLFERLLQDVLRSVMLPYFAEEGRFGGDVRAKLRLVSLNVSALSMFAIGLTGVLAEPAIALLFGPQWALAVPVAQALCVGMALRCLSPTIASALIANGGVSRVMHSSIVATTSKIILLIAMSPYGLMYAAVGFVAAEALSIIILVWHAQRSGLFLVRDYFEVMIITVPPALIGISAAICVELAIAFPENLMGLLVNLITASVAASVVWLAVIWAFGLPPKDELQRLFKRLAGR